MYWVLEGPKRAMFLVSEGPCMVPEACIAPEAPHLVHLYTFTSRWHSFEC